jgi:hypothetical protein
MFYRTGVQEAVNWLFIRVQNSRKQYCSLALRYTLIILIVLCRDEN